MSRRGAVLAPGYSGSEDQRILVTLARRLTEAGFSERRVTFSTRGHHVSRGYFQEIADIRMAREGLTFSGVEKIALIGRSFGGRMCAFLAAEEPPDALVLVGHPIAPPDRPRPRDETTLASIRCPTLVVQGDRDELGPLAVIRRIAASNPLIDVVVLKDAQHSLTELQEREAVEHVARWLDAVFGP